MIDSNTSTDAGTSPDTGRLFTPADAVAWLRSVEAVRARANEMLALAEENVLEHFRLRPENIERAADYVVETIRERYPSLAIPFHSRWRHFCAGNTDRWAMLRKELDTDHIEAPEVARMRFDLAVTSVLLDAGAGPGWCYRESGSGERYTRSEGLAVASFDAFRAGLFSADGNAPLRADGAGLAALTGELLARAFQVGPDNPLIGLDDRAALLSRLGAALESRPHLFGTQPARVGGLFDYLAARADTGGLPATEIVDALLAGLDGIWPSRPALDGVELGDVWRHPAIQHGDAADGWVPFHKLTQWLAYSLVEPLEEAGIRVTRLDALTGLPEYRNGGLLIDMGVLEPSDAAALTRSHSIDSTFVVEWRALTVALLDRLADRVRERLGMDAGELPLLKILEGGTWQAGRRIARERRGELAPPPVQVISDGTVF